MTHMTWPTLSLYILMILLSHSLSLFQLFDEAMVAIKSWRPSSLFSCCTSPPKLFPQHLSVSRLDLDLTKCVVLFMFTSTRLHLLFIRFWKAKAERRKKTWKLNSKLAAWLAGSKRWNSDAPHFDGNKICKMRQGQKKSSLWDVKEMEKMGPKFACLKTNFPRICLVSTKVLTFLFQSHPWGSLSLWLNQAKLCDFSLSPCQHLDGVESTILPSQGIEKSREDPSLSNLVGCAWQQANFEMIKSSRRRRKGGWWLHQFETWPQRERQRPNLGWFFSPTSAKSRKDSLCLAFISFLLTFLSLFFP